MTAGPIAILQFTPRVPPGYFESWAREAGFALRQVAIHACDAVPASAAGLGGICLCGGEMSVNDPLDWIEPVCALIRDADRSGVPVIGHCLGGQLIARAFGAVVEPNAVKEIGWSEIESSDAGLAAEWLADLPRFETFQWHGDRFDLPRGAERLLTGPWCENQAYVLPATGRTEPGANPAAAHLGMQCHLEITPSTIDDWIGEADGEIDDALSAGMSGTVQTPEQMRAAAGARADRLNRVARHLYERWGRGLRRVA
ncbi:GMP synthase [soil metagenome]